MKKFNLKDVSEFDLLADVEKKKSLEIYYMRGVFQKLSQVMKLAKDAYAAGNDTSALLNFAQAKVLYNEFGIVYDYICS